MHYSFPGPRLVSYLFLCLLYIGGCSAVQLPSSEVTESDVAVKDSVTSVDKNLLDLQEKDHKSMGVHFVQTQTLPLKEEDKYEPQPLHIGQGRELTPQNIKGRSKPYVSADVLQSELTAGSAFEGEFHSTPVIINMENAELYDVVLFFVKQLGLNCIIEPDIKGKITIHTAGELNEKDLFPLFFQILEANGLTAIKEGKFYRIITMDNAPRASLPLLGDEAGGGEGRQGMVMQIIPLHYIKTEEMVKILAPFISEKGSLVSHVNSNTLLLVDSSRNIEKIMKLVRSFDVDLFASIGHRLFKVKYVNSTSVAKIISEVLLSYGDKDKKIKIINLEKLNSLMVLSADENIFEKVDELLSEIDVPGNDAESHIYLYFLKNSQAADMGGLLKSIFTKKEEEKIKIKKTTETGNTKGETTNPFSLGEKVNSVKLTRKKTGSDFGSGALRGEIKITEDSIRNALIIDAIPSDYRIVERVLKRLDILPRQVLISVTIVDVQLDDDLDLGVEWKYSHRSDDTQEHPSFLNIATGSAGLGFVIGQTLKWDARLSALASKKKIDIIATPSVLASDNIAAKIDISTEIPVASAQIQYDDSSNNTNKTQTDIQYRNTGIILNATPHINEYGLVTMDISQEVSEQSKAVKVGNSSYPSFFKRSVKTTLTVNSGQTIAIGGLIREVKSKSSSGVPFLSEIPLIGWLFGTKGKGVSKSELIILITPRVVGTPDDIDAVTAEFTKKFDHQIEL